MAIPRHCYPISGGALYPPLPARSSSAHFSQNMNIETRRHPPALAPVFLQRNRYFPVLISAGRPAAFMARLWMLKLWKISWPEASLILTITDA
jgi:hypothetical protein